MRGFLAFAICFALLFQVWWRHYNFFRSYDLEDAPTIALTGVLLFVVLFYVYPLKFLWSRGVRRQLGWRRAVADDVMPSDRCRALFADLQRRRGRRLRASSRRCTVNAYPRRDELGLDAGESLETADRRSTSNPGLRRRRRRCRLRSSTFGGSRRGWPASPATCTS